MAISEQLLETYGEKHLDEEYTHWVYVMKCRDTHRTFDELQRKARSRLSREPPWLRDAFEHNKLYYVGQTENLEKRIGQHLKKEKSSDFTTLFEPYQVACLVPEHSRNSAEYREKRLAEQWGSGPNRYAYSY